MYVLFATHQFLTSDRLQGREGLVPGVEQQKTLSQHLQWWKVRDLPWEMATWVQHNTCQHIHKINIISHYMFMYNSTCTCICALKECTCTNIMCMEATCIYKRIQTAAACCTGHMYCVLSMGLTVSVVPFVMADTTLMVISTSQWQWPWRWEATSVSQQWWNTLGYGATPYTCTSMYIYSLVGGARRQTKSTMYLVVWWTLWLVSC